MAPNILLYGLFALTHAVPSAWVLFQPRLPVIATYPNVTSFRKASLKTQGQQGPLPHDWLPLGVIQGSGHSSLPVYIWISKTGQTLCWFQEPHPCSPVMLPIPCLVQIRERRAICPHSPTGSPVVRPGLTAKASSGTFGPIQLLPGVT